MDSSINRSLPSVKPTCIYVPANTKKIDQHTESSDTIDATFENIESHPTEWENSVWTASATVNQPGYSAYVSSKVVEASASKNDGSFETNQKKSLVNLHEGPRFPEKGYLDYCTTKIHDLKVEPDNNLNEFVSENLFSHNKKPSKLEAPEPKAHLRLEDFLSHIFKWNPAWLKENEDYSTPPSVVNKNRITAMLPSYRSLKHYYEIVEPLLILELWKAVIDDYKEEKTDPKKFSIVPYSMGNSGSFNNQNVSTLELEMVVSEQDFLQKAHPSHGDLISFNYLSKATDGRDSTTRTVFAYVTECRKAFIATFTKFNHNLLSTVKEPHTLITITVMTKALDSKDVQTETVCELQNISYIRSNIRMVQALQQLDASLLMNMILHPKIEDYQLLPANNVKDYRLVTKDSLNTKQLEAVMRITETAIQKLPKICLIQGPPGTGKSTVIVNLVMQMLHGNRCNSGKKLKILMCAPSNTAIDEIALRLLKRQQSVQEEDRFTLVRIGRTNAMHPTVKAVSLQELAKKNNDLIVYEHSSLNSSSNTFQVESKAERSERMRILKKHRNAEINLLKSADVIASTLASSYTSQMELAFRGTNDTIDVCIVDEASQCTEPESLIPLMLGVKILVLVGDTNQLPATVLSQKAKNLGFGQSLFARIERVFKRTPNNPIIQLDVQYRMTVPVALFPNKYFYSGMLQNAARVQKLPFHLYRVINLDSIQDRAKFFNLGEAKFVANLIYTMIPQADHDDTSLPVKVGIITPYKNQKTLLTERITNRITFLKNKHAVDVDVNTVDSFQGQERDVIIMSCVRSSGIGFLSDRHRLCVALTRAKHSLIICGNFKTFEKDPMWNALLDDAKSRGVYVDVKSDASPEDIKRHIIR